MSLTADVVRARIAARLEGLVVASGVLHEAPGGYDAIPERVPHALSHLAFGVALPSTGPTLPQRQRQGRELYVTTAASVRLLHRYRVQVHGVTDMDGALAMEAAAIIACVGTSGASGLQVTYQGSRRQTANVPDDLYLIELTLQAAYTIDTV